MSHITLIQTLPPRLAALVTDCAWQKDEIGYSGAHVFRLVKPDGNACFLKMADGYLADEVQIEAAVMGWIGGKLPTPQLLYSEATGERAFLLMTALPGADMTQFNNKPDVDKETAVRLLAKGLHWLHRLPIAGCPFDQRLTTKIAAAGQHLVQGQVDEADFDIEHTAAEAYQELLATRPGDEDLVFTHGDYCLPNILATDGRISGFIDLGRAGVADRYQDLALCTRSLCHNFGPGWESPFLAHYGIPQPDEAKIAFYRLLDEFF